MVLTLRGPFQDGNVARTVVPSPGVLATWSTSPLPREGQRVEQPTPVRTRWRPATPQAEPCV
jgi:hypothetical protein